MSMAYGRLDKETYLSVYKYAEQHDAEIRDFYKLRPTSRIGFDRALRFMLKRLRDLGEWE